MGEIKWRVVLWSQTNYNPLYTVIVYSKHNYATSLCKALMWARMICIFVQKLTSIATCPKNHVLELIVGQGQYVST